MTKLQELSMKIEEMRKSLYDLILEKGDLLDEEIVVASQTLDKALNDYNDILIKKEK